MNQNIDTLSKLIIKIFREEDFSDSEWNDVTHLAFVAMCYLYENSNVIVTPETKQLHLQPKADHSARRRKRK